MHARFPFGLCLRASFGRALSESLHQHRVRSSSALELAAGQLVGRLNKSRIPSSMLGYFPGQDIRTVVRLT
jgi:hypothetical protein